MDEKKRFLYISGNILFAVALTAGLSIYYLYRTTLRHQRDRLMETAQSQARLMEAVKDPARIIEAHKGYQPYGETGEIVLGTQIASEIVFLLRHGKDGLDFPKPVRVHGDLAEPMRRALRGLSGTMIGRDYDGTVVIAAHEPLQNEGYAVVAKIDLAEIRGPFVKAGLVTILGGLFAVVLGAVFYLLILAPVVARRQESETKYRSLFDSAADMIFLVQPESGRFTEMNRTGCELLGYSRDEILDLNLADALPSEHEREETLRVFREALATGSSTRVVTFLTRAGKPVEAEIRCAPIPGEGGNWLIGIGRDLTAQRLLERRAMAFFQAFRNSQDYMFYTDRKGTILEINDAFLKRFGFSRAECVGNSPRIVRSRFTTNETYKKMWGSILDPAKGYWTGRVVNKTKTGEEIPVLLSITGVQDERGEIIGFVSSAVDLSEVEKLQRKLSKSERLAAVGSMAAVVAHEIRNPLSSIVTAAGSIARGDLEASDRDMLIGIIRKESKRLNDTLTQFLQYSRPREIRKRPTALAGEVQEIIQMVRSDTAVLGEVDIRTSFDPALPEVRIDPDQFRQVLWNIVINALQAMDGRGRLALATRLDGTDAVLEISDTGPGIPEDQIAEIFEPFKTSKTKGSGLGLAVAERVVSAHGGRILVDSSLGKGSVFSILIPLEDT